MRRHSKREEQIKPFPLYSLNLSRFTGVKGEHAPPLLDCHSRFLGKNSLAMTDGGDQIHFYYNELMGNSRKKSTNAVETQNGDSKKSQIEN